MTPQRRARRPSIQSVAAATKKTRGGGRVESREDERHHHRREQDAHARASREQTRRAQDAQGAGLHGARGYIRAGRRRIGAPHRRPRRRARRRAAARASARSTARSAALASATSGRRHAQLRDAEAGQQHRGRGVAGELAAHADPAPAGGRRLDGRLRSGAGRRAAGRRAARRGARRRARRPSCTGSGRWCRARRSRRARPGAPRVSAAAGTSTMIPTSSGASMPVAGAPRRAARAPRAPRPAWPPSGTSP